MQSKRGRLFPPKGKAPHKPGEPRNILSRLTRCPDCLTKYRGKLCPTCEGEQAEEDQQAEE